MTTDPRPRIAVLGFAILGLLAIRPRTGYDLARAMRKPIGYMWTAGHSQIYPELARLEAAGLIAATVIEGPGPRDTKRYAITPAGTDALTAWADSPLTEVARSELMLRVRALWLLPPERAVAFVRRERHRAEQLLTEYLAEEATFALEGDDVDDPASFAFAEYATLRSGIIRVRGQLAWCDWLLDRLHHDRLQSTEPVGDQPAVER